MWLLQATSPLRAAGRIDVGVARMLRHPEAARLVEVQDAELDRTGAFDREALVVVTTTGTGWVNSMAAGAIEYMYGGDSAIVATQYSYLPSALSFLADRGKAATAGRELFDAVYRTGNVSRAAGDCAAVELRGAGLDRR